MASPMLVTWLGDRDHHETGRGHPERARLDAVVRGIGDADLDQAVAWSSGRAADRVELARVHDPRSLDALERFADAGGGNLDAASSPGFMQSGSAGRDRIRA